MSPADTDCVPFSHYADDLNIRVLVFYLGYAVEAASVDLLVRVLPHDVQRGINLQLFTKNVGTFGTDILTIRYISLR